MKKKSLFCIATVICLIFNVMFLWQISAFADEEKTWSKLTPLNNDKSFFHTEVINGQIYAFCGYDASLEVYSPLTDTWTVLASMNKARRSCQSEVIDGKIYVIGGGNSSLTSILNTLEVYDPETNKWTKLASMNEARFEFQTEVINGKIYAVGGRGLNTVEVYDPTTDKWTKLASMYEIRNGLSTEVIDGKIYAMGGYKLKTVEVYDPTTNKWTKSCSMNEARQCFQTEVIDGKIYAIGGDIGYGSAMGALNTVEVYDPETVKWTNIASMNEAREYFQSKVINGKIYVLGGKRRAKALKTVEVYDLVTNKWTNVASMNEARQYFQSEVIDGKIYALGSGSSMEVYSIPGDTSDTSDTVNNKLKVVLEPTEKLQLSVDDDLDENADMSWTSSNTSVATVNGNGVVTALAPGNTKITVTSEDGTYTDYINVLVVEDADDYRLAVDLKVGQTSRLTIDDLTDTVKVKWVSMDSSIAKVSSKGKVKAVSEGLALVTALDKDGNIIGKVYVRVRE